MTWSYSVSDLLTNTKDQVRFLIGDTDTNDQQLQDEEINYTLAIRSSVWGASAVCCDSIASKASRRADTTTGELRTLYSGIAKAYFARAAMYESKSAELGGALPFAGGITVSGKQLAELDPDRIPSNFNIGMTDNWNMPVAPAGNEPSVPAEVGPNVV